MRRLLSLVVLVLSLSVVTGVAPLPAAAAMGDASVTLARLSPSTVTAGRPVKLEARVRSTVAVVATVAVAIVAPGGEVVWEKVWSDRPIRRGKTLTFKATWVAPPDLISGGYELRVRVLDADDQLLAEPKTVGFTMRGVAAPAPPAPNPPANNPTTNNPPADAVDAEAAAFLTLVNDYRRAHGLGPLSLHPALTAAAVWHGQDMGAKAYFSHTDSLGRDPFQRMAAFGYTASTWKAENIAAGYNSAAQAFAGWKDSPGHNTNMLGEHYRSIGIGRVSVPGSPYGVYWATTFGGE